MRAVALTAGAVVTAVLLAGCGGGTGDGGAKSRQAKGSSVSASPTEEMRLSRAAVRRNIRVVVAAGGFDGVDDSAGTSARCRVIATVRTDGRPKTAAVSKVVADLKGRGWEQVFRKPEDGGVTWFLTRANWGMYVFLSAPSAEDPDAPLFTLSAMRLDCSSVTTRAFLLDQPGSAAPGTAPRGVVARPEYAQYADHAPPCDAPHRTPRPDPT
ncbi:hypothetical protein [Streptomyces sp. NPDC017991]|uniref:hypothetical protein n=1 Tax=Streptomyces sp. NPDC017991 TaxID=3365026 RepID=UPI0037A67099